MPKFRGGRAPAVQSAKAVEPTAGTHRHRLAALIADMIPGARTLRVSQREPGRSWPSPYARAYDAQGQLIALNRPQGMTAARWVIRAHPDVTWEEAYDLDLATGTLRPAGAYAATGGGR
ncbi:hypothetical protein Sgleb_59640 [Streptomyces glebosus]|uniref:Uncharacterized protein n=1 Tax=Streptomyces glebosus TaxID=249580 RepID=A0A640T2F9_9ACTN|nr:hypothetical protein Sgleb_59640 [Streptomyces glebosus]GHG47115.1 hypothetical protein GCM10010513_03350 [Streptomyces glebosus]